MGNFRKPIAVGLALVLFGGGIYFFVKKAALFLEPARSASLEVVKKAHPVKPKNFRDRFGDSAKAPAEEPFTFFETLNDSSMEKFVGLDGKVHSVARQDSPGQEPKVAPPATPSHRKPSVDRSPEETDSSKSISQRLDELSSNEASGFAVQVSSFRERERAEALKDSLVKKGYPVFLATADMPEGGGAWHRVMLGRYKDWESANLAAARARSEEKLNAVVVLAED